MLSHSTFSQLRKSRDTRRTRPLKTSSSPSMREISLERPMTANVPASGCVAGTEKVSSSASSIGERSSTS